MLKYQLLVFFCHYLDENHMKEMKMRKEIVLLLASMTKNKSSKRKIQERCFQMRTQSKKVFQDSSLKVSFYGLYVSICYNKLPLFRGSCVQFESRPV